MTSYKKSLTFIGISLLLFTFARAAIFLRYHDQFSALSNWEIIRAFFEGARFDLSSITVFFGPPLLIFNLPGKIFQNRWTRGLFSLIAFLLMSVGFGFLICDVIYFGYVKRHITYELLLMSSEDYLALAEMALRIYLPYLIITILTLTLLGVECYKISRIPHASTRPRKKFVGYYIVFLILLITIGRGGIGDKPITIIDAFSRGSSAYGNLVLNGVFSFSHSSLRGKAINHHHLAKTEARQILRLDPHSAFPFIKKHAAKGTKHPNLVFVLIESLSFKYLDALANRGYGVTSHLDSICAESLTFTNFFASGQRSLEGIQATLTGIPSIIGLPTIGIGLLATYSKLGHIARKNGYSTMFIQSSKRRSLRVDAIAGSLGFQEYFGKEDMPILLDYQEVNGAKFGWDYETLMFAADKIDRIEKPFLVYIFTGTTHTPFPRLPNGLEKYPHNPDNEKGFLNTLNYTDWSIGEFMGRLKKRPWFNNTIFVFTGDHALAHFQTGPFPEKFHIPLIIYAPGMIKPAIVKDVSSQLDLFPTLIQLMNLEASFSSFGNNLLTPTRDPFAFVRNGSIVGIITSEGYLSHSLKNRLETGGSSLSPADFDTMEKKLLATDQMVYETLLSNQWAR